MMRVLESFVNIDRRIMYALLCVIIVGLLIKPVSQPIASTRAVKGAFDAVENMPRDKIAIVSVTWGASTTAENATQTEALMRHMFRRGVRFALVAWDQQGAKLARDIARRLSREMKKTYGVDWCDWGYRPAFLAQVLPALAKDIPKTIQRDQAGTDVRKLPMMKNVRTIGDVGLVAEITPAGTLDYWIMFIQGVYHTPIVYAPTLVMAPEAFNNLDAHQIVGMLPGLPGAGEYEQMLGSKGFGQKASTALSGAHLLVVILIVLGNVGMFAAARRRRGADRDEAG